MLLQRCFFVLAGLYLVSLPDFNTAIYVSEHMPATNTAGARHNVDNQMLPENGNSHCTNKSRERLLTTEVGAGVGGNGAAVAVAMLEDRGTARGCTACLHITTSYTISFHTFIITTHFITILAIAVIRM